MFVLARSLVGEGVALPDRMLMGWLPLVASTRYGWLRFDGSGAIVRAPPCGAERQMAAPAVLVASATIALRLSALASTMRAVEPPPKTTASAAPAACRTIT
jgi:hypothetical protein